MDNKNIVRAFMIATVVILVGEVYIFWHFLSKYW